MRTKARLADRFAPDDRILPRCERVIFPSRMRSRLPKFEDRVPGFPTLERLLVERILARWRRAAMAVRGL